MLEKQYLNIKNLLKIILNMWVIILLTKQEQSIITKKKKKKGIYGTASKHDLKELKEEGIDAQMIPWVEDKKN